MMGSQEIDQFQVTDLKHKVQNNVDLRYNDRSRAQYPESGDSPIL